MRWYKIERVWNACLLLAFCSVVLTATVQFLWPTCLSRTDAEALLAELDSPIYLVQLDACVRAGQVSWNLIRPSYLDGEERDPRASELDHQIWLKLINILENAKTNEEKILALRGFAGMPGCAYRKAFDLARQCLNSDDPELLNAAIEMANGSRETVGKRLIEIAYRYPQCQRAALNRIGAIYCEKGFPWGDTPDGEVLALARKAAGSFDIAVRAEALSLIELHKHRMEQVRELSKFAS